MILYVTNHYKWKVFGVTRAYYEALKDEGHDVRLVMTDDPNLFTEAKRPDIDHIWVVNSSKVFTDSQAQLLRKTKTMIGFNLTKRWSIGHKEQFHTLFATTTLPGTVFLPPAIYEPYHRLLDIPRDIGVGFIGRIGGHPNKDIRNSVLANIPGLQTFSKIRGQEYIKLLNRMKVGVEVDPQSAAPTIPHRIVELISCGVLCIAPYRKDVAKMFIYGEEIVGYHSIPELYTKIEHYLKDDEERERVTQRGTERCRAEHTSVNRVRKVIELCH